MPTKFCHHCGNTYASPRCPCQGQTGARGSTRRWRNLRAAVIARDEGHCQRCNSTANLEVHHLQAKRDKGPDAASNLIALCSDCHKEIERDLAA